MIPGQMTHAPMQPHSAAPAQSPLVALLARHAQATGPQMQHPMGAAPQAPGAPMPLNVGGHAAARFGHSPAMIPGM